MELFHEIRTDAYVIIIAGSVDGSNAGELDNAFHKAIKSQQEQILVDGHKLTYISSAGIGIFLSHLPHLREKGIRLTFEGLNANTRQIFQILGLDNLLTFSDTSLVA
jgi:anti-sigma B factor antagonist